MGVKRPLEENTCHETSLKQAKQLDGCNKSIEIAESEVFEKAATPRKCDAKVGESGFDGKHEEDTVDKDLETSATSSWITSSSGEEESGNVGSFFLPLYSELFELDLPRRPPAQHEDVYTFLFHSSPRKEVPVGPDHQADVPEWHPDSTADDDEGQKLVGKSIIAMPETIVSSCGDVKIGKGRTDFDCSDRGSMRCTQQHVEDAREQLRESIGEEKFAELGFLDMGEAVALKWSDVDERVFHEVVYSNPVSLGKRFWKHLSVAFPSRTKMELVSYYFNVFILQRRAVQNRSDMLDIDSNDDEWQGEGRFPCVRGDDDDSVVESFGDEDLHVDHEIGVSCETGDDNENGDGIGDNDDCHNGQQEPTMTSKADPGFNPSVKNVDESVSCNARVHYTSAEDNPTINCSEGLSNGNEALGAGFVLDRCDAKTWDDSFFTSGHAKNMDLLPTHNMIEEIFGPCTWNGN